MQLIIGSIFGFLWAGIVNPSDHSDGVPGTPPDLR